METKYLGYRFSSVKITASCLWIWFTGIHLWIQQTKHLQCSLKSYKLLSMVRSTKNKILLMQQLKVACSHLIYNHFSRKLVLQTRIFFGSTTLRLFPRFLKMKKNMKNISSSVFPFSERTSNSPELYDTSAESPWFQL